MMPRNVVKSGTASTLLSSVMIADADADAEQRDADRQAHGQHRAEREDQDDDGEGEAEHLGRRWLELGEDLTAELDLHAVDLRRQSRRSRRRSRRRGRTRCRRAARRWRTRSCRLRVLADAICGGPPGSYGLSTRTTSGIAGDLVEQRLHRCCDLGIVDALLGAEHDRADLAGALAAELGVEDVEARRDSTFGQVELVAAR